MFSLSKDFLKFRLVLEKGTGIPVLKCYDNGGRLVVVSSQYYGSLGSHCHL